MPPLAHSPEGSIVVKCVSSNDALQGEDVEAATSYRPPGADCRRGRLSPKQLAALQMDTQKTGSFYALGAVFRLRFSPASDLTIVQYSHVFVTVE